MDDHVVITKVQNTSYSPGVPLNKDYIVDTLVMKYDALLGTNKTEGTYFRTSIVSIIEVIEDYQMKVYTANSVYLLSFLAKAQSELFKQFSRSKLAKFKFK